MPQRAGSAVQWFPGHMARTLRRLAEDVRISDVVIEAVDARIPQSGRNPALAGVAGKKPHIVVLTREDLADPQVTAAWVRSFDERSEAIVAMNGKRQGSIARLQTLIGELLTAMRRPARAMVVGIPNAGKSTIINALARKNVARVEDRAGVTRAPQWFRAGSSLEVMDTAGVLVPKIDGPTAQWMLAMCGAVPRARFDAEEVVGHFVEWTKERGITVTDLATFARERGFVRHGNELDSHNAAWSYIKEWSDGRFGRMTLELPQT
jgi:ribosome biogenesis GTPase A